MGKEKNKEPKVHRELNGFRVEIDKFGEIKGNFDIDKVNEFLNRNLEDKKLKHEE